MKELLNALLYLIVAVASCAFWYNKGYSEGCCESYEKQTIEYIKRYAPKMYEDLAKGDEEE